MAAKTSHIEVAVKDGMKAGFRAYMGSCATSGLPQVQQRYDALNSMSNREAFRWYCNEFGKKVERASSTPASATSTARKVMDRLTTKAAPKTETEIERLKRELAEAEARANAPQAEAEVPKREVPTGPQIKLIERIAARKGDKVEVSVKLNGKALTFEAGGAYIEAAIASGVIRFKK